MITVIVPTIESRQPIFDRFMGAWQSLFDEHDVHFIKVLDGERPLVYYRDLVLGSEDVMGEYIDCLSNFNAGIRNLGFAFVAKNFPDCEMILTLDDDVIPIGDPIQDHLDALRSRMSTSWMSTIVDYYPRGFPYNARDEAEVVLSHGVWEGVADWDAPTQLVMGSHREVEFYKGPIPKGALFSVCSMNLAFKPKLLPWIYQAPWADVKRYDDILAGITAKTAIDNEGWAAVSGYARVYHERASNVFTNLENEATGMKLNEGYWKGEADHPYFKLYEEKLLRWQEFIKTCPISQ